MQDPGLPKVIARAPMPVLRPFVSRIWAADETSSANPFRAERERLLPSGTMHLVFRLCEHPLRLFDSPDDRLGRTFDHGVVGGARAGFYLRDISKPVKSVGAQLTPGACSLLFGVPADELAGRHTSLDDLWGRASQQIRERLLEQETLEKQLALFEWFLAQRLPRVCGIHPAVAHALSRFSLTTEIGEIVEETGYSHRRFIQLFRRTIGLPPRLYCRILRFQNAIQIAARNPQASWVSIALDAGYSDQAHFNHEFRELAGGSPSEYRAACQTPNQHFPILPRR